MPAIVPEPEQFAEIQCSNLAPEEEFASLQAMHRHPVYIVLVLQ